jgi:hypothetical protein
MPAPFRKLTLEEFADLLARFPFTRRIDAVHMHHTWRPNHSQYRGLSSIEAMWRFHTQQNGWSDIAQHLTIAPDGAIWTGRNWNQPPASAGGFNGNRRAGPFMFEMIGDFDLGRDRFEGPQREAAIQVIALVQERFGLSVESLRFHNQMSPKTCPGSAIKYPEILDAVRQARETLGSRAVSASDERPFGEEALAVRAVTEAALASFTRAERDDAADAELAEEEMPAAEREAMFFELGAAATRAPISADGRRGREFADGRRALSFAPALLSELRPHVINLAQGRFSSGGNFDTSPGDVDAIFGEHLPRALEAAQARNEKLRLMFYAQGGLVAESAGLRIAHKHIAWWKRNNVYPIYFVWETGLLGTIGQILLNIRQRAVRAGVRDLADFTTDPLVEVAARSLGGEKIWAGLKRSAELSVAEDGGAQYTARKLKEFCDAHQGQVELHAVGHSAGSIFHAHFIPTALNFGLPPFESVHFLAPAIRTDVFQRQLAGRMNNGINQLSIFTMGKDWEKADNCAQVYRKSLLYLIHHALEPEAKTPILGLEESLRGDPQLSAIFGLGGHPARNGEVIWAKSQATTGRSASTSITHGGFDDDAPTMNSVARRILQASDDAVIVNYAPAETEARALDGWEIELPGEAAYLFGAGAEIITAAPAPPVTPPMTMTAPAIGAGISGRRRALCIGINDYRTSPLAGCVADAQTWAAALKQLGFEEPRLLLNEQATRDEILKALRELVTSSQAGDVLVFQYAGHGTQLPDHNRDEGEDGKDEALCPIDFDSGAFVIDDDVAEIFRGIPFGVNITCFIDCCHSGTISRFAIGSTHAAPGTDQRPRFLVASDEMKQAHLQFRARMGASRAVAARGPETMKEIVFSACRSSEVAWESNGHGDFTTRATNLLRAGIDGITNEQFQSQVIVAFGATPRQHPELDCAPAARALSLLQPLSLGVGAAFKAAAAGRF